MTKHYCVRCGKQKDRNDLRILTVRNWVPAKYEKYETWENCEKYDICEDCEKDLKDWLEKSGEKEVNQMKKTTYALVTHYSFDSETPVYLFDTVEEAAAELRKQFDEEVRISTEEDGHVIGEDMEVDIAEDGRWASITEYVDEDTDVTEWSIGCVRNR